MVNGITKACVLMAIVAFVVWSCLSAPIVHGEHANHQRTTCDTCIRLIHQIGD